MTQSCGFLPFYERGTTHPEDDNFNEADRYHLPVFLCDSSSALHVAKAEDATRKTKHYDLRWHSVKDWAKSFVYVNTETNLADPLTKPMAQQWKYLQLFYHEPDEKQYDYFKQRGAAGDEDSDEDDEQEEQAMLCVSIWPESLRRRA